MSFWNSWHLVYGSSRPIFLSWLYIYSRKDDTGLYPTRDVLDGSGTTIVACPSPVDDGDGQFVGSSITSGAL